MPGSINRERPIDVENSTRRVAVIFGRNLLHTLPIMSLVDGQSVYSRVLTDCAHDYTDSGSRVFVTYFRPRVKGYH